jgi:hypothetical protein
MPTYTVGSGGDFSTPKDALDWVNTQSPQLEYVFDVISNITWNSEGSYYNPTNADSSIKFTSTHNESLKNDQSQWYTLTCTDNYPALYLQPYSYWAPCIVEYLKFVNCVDYCIRFGWCTNYLSRVNNCVFILEASFPSINRAIHAGVFGQNYLKIYNCLSYKGTLICNNYGGTGYDPPSPRKHLYNCMCYCPSNTAYPNQIFWQPLSTVLNVVIKNVFAFGYTDPVPYNMFQGNYSPTCTVDYCATSTDSIYGGSGNISNVNYLNELLSIDHTSPNFMKPKKSSSVAKLGCDPSSIISNDFAGIVYASPFPIGAYELISTSGGRRIIGVV